MKNYYAILEVARDADGPEIKTAYRTLAQKWHPDKHSDGTKAAAEEKFKEISEAYSVLSDEEKKLNYDTTGSPDSQPSFGFHTTGDPFDILRRVSGVDFGMGGPRAPRSMKGQSIQEAIEISLKDALFGTEHPLKYQIVSSCEACDGSCAEEFEICDQCQGQGGVTLRRGSMVVHQTCGGCGGQGRKISKICKECSGRGTQTDIKNLTVSIPKGISHGATLRLAGQGGRGFHGGPPGDILLLIKVQYPDLNRLSEEEKEQLVQLISK